MFVSIRLSNVLVAYDKRALDEGLPPTLVGSQLALSGDGLTKVIGECRKDTNLPIATAVHAVLADTRASLGLPIVPGDDIPIGNIDTSGLASKERNAAPGPDAAPIPTRPKADVKVAPEETHSLMETLERYEHDAHQN